LPAESVQCVVTSPAHRPAPPPGPRCCDWPMWPRLESDRVVCLLCGRQLPRCRWVDPGLIIAAGGLGR
jgi:hypothetical protein